MSLLSKFLSGPKALLHSDAGKPFDPQSNSARSRDLLIDLLRGLAAVAVALFHFNEGHPALGDLYHTTIKLGWLGVPVFFVISGYCIAAAANRPQSSVTGFWLRRFVRIFLPYWASVALVLAMIGFRVATFGVNDIAVLPQSIEGWLYCFAALTNPASPYTGLNWVYWSLAYEIAFYVAMGMAFARFGMVWLCAFSLLASCLDVYPFDQWALFGLGVGCYYLLRKRSWASCALFAICSWSILARGNHAVSVVGFAAALGVLYPPPMGWLASLSRLRFMGEISYSLYLVHVPVGCYFVQQLLGDYLRRDTLLASWARDSALLLASLAVAIAFHRLVERPSHQLARNARAGKE